MKLLLFCPHFRPDLHAATGEVMTQLVEALAERDHRISVVTSLPWYRGHKVDPAWSGRPWRREKTEWGQVVRVWPFPTDKTNIPARALGFGGMTSIAGGLGLDPRPSRRRSWRCRRRSSSATRPGWLPSVWGRRWCSTPRTSSPTSPLSSGCCGAGGWWSWLGGTRPRSTVEPMPSPCSRRTRPETSGPRSSATGDRVCGVGGPAPSTTRST